MIVLMNAVLYLMKRKFKKIYFELISNTKIIYIILLNEVASYQDFSKLTGDLTKGEELDKGRLDKRRLDKGRLDKGRLDKGRLDKGRLDKGRLDKGRLDKGRLDKVEYSSLFQTLNY